MDDIRCRNCKLKPSMHSGPGNDRSSRPCSRPNQTHRRQGCACVRQRAAFRLRRLEGKSGFGRHVFSAVAYDFRQSTAVNASLALLAPTRSSHLKVQQTRSSWPLPQLSRQRAAKAWHRSRTSLECTRIRSIANSSVAILEMCTEGLTTASTRKRMTPARSSPAQRPLALCS